MVSARLAALPGLRSLQKAIAKEGDSRMECKKEENLQSCNCSYEPCPRKGICCECISYHLKSRQLPACCFPADAERKYDRSFDHFARLVTAGKV
jgi:hypothetical protein